MACIVDAEAHAAPQAKVEPTELDWEWARLLQRALEQCSAIQFKPGANRGYVTEDGVRLIAEWLAATSAPIHPDREAKGGDLDCHTVGAVAEALAGLSVRAAEAIEKVGPDTAHIILVMTPVEAQALASCAPLSINPQ